MARGPLRELRAPPPHEEVTQIAEADVEWNDDRDADQPFDMMQRHVLPGDGYQTLSRSIAFASAFADSYAPNRSRYTCM